MKSDSKSPKPSFIPRSIMRTLRKLNQRLDPNAELKVVEEFRASRQRTVTSIRYLLILITVPLLVNQLSKTLVINPLIDKFWSQEQSKVFLNFSQSERALAEFKIFEREIRFEVLLGKTPELSPKVVEQKVKEKAIRHLQNRTLLW